MGDLIRLCSIDEVKVGEKRRFKLKDLGVEVLLVRLEDGFYAMENRCPHAGCPLSFYGEVREGNKLQCNCHGAVFDLRDGRVIEGPAQSPLRTYKVTIFNNEVFVEI
ncbi:MAG: Rieske (2Fe-2S) protein [Candidatus Nezhaarchaeales archaeon]